METRAGDEKDSVEERPRWSHLSTESRHPASQDLDTLPSEEVVGLLLKEDRRGIEAALHHKIAIAEVAEWVADALAAGGDLVFAGAGTSGRLGILEAAECPPTFGTDPQRIRGLMAGGEDAVFRAVEGAEDRGDDGRKAARDLGSSDILIALSASSVTPFARGALAQARELGARTVLLTCAAPAGLEDQADRVLALETGPEVLTGSTRLKAGSATKAVLNAITTTAMVRLGKVFGNLMVDLKPGSAKLVDRSIRIIEIAGQVSRPEAERLYEASERNVKVAIVMARCEVSAEASTSRLRRAEGQVRVVISGS